MPSVDLPGLLARLEPVVREVIAPAAAQIDTESAWCEPGIRALQAAGFGGLVVPQETGGLGHGLLALTQVCESIGRTCGSTAISYGMHCVGAAVIAAQATDVQKHRYLVPISAGTHLTTLALSEQGTGSHFYLPQTTMAPTSDGQVQLSGSKSFVTNGGCADSYVVSVAPGVANAPPGEFSCFVVPAATPGLVWQEPWQGWGMRGNSARSLEIRQAVIARDGLLGREGDEIWYVFQVVAPFFLMAMAGTYLGIAQACLDAGRTHLMRRSYSHTGQSLGQNPVLQHRLGELWSQVERTRQLIYHAAALGDRQTADALPALCAAKAEVAECVVTLANEVMTLMGGRAYGSDSPIHRYLRDARAAHIMSPTTDILRTWTGRALLDLPLLGD